MHDSLPLSTVVEQLGKLRNAFPNTRENRPASVVAELYREHLIGVSPDVLRAAVTRVIRDDEFFPKIARLRKVASEIEASRERERASHAIASSADEQTCPNCRVRYHAATHYAPKMVLDHNNKPLWPELTPDARYVLLEPKGRTVCECTAPSRWQPLDDQLPPVAELKTLLRYHEDLLIRAGLARYEGGELIGIARTPLLTAGAA